MKKKEKVVLSAEKKVLKKQERKYKIFRNKTLAIVCSILFLASVIITGIGTKVRSNEFLYLMGNVCTILSIVLPFLIFRSPALAIMLSGGAMLDISFIFNITEPMPIGIILLIISLISFAIGGKIRDKKKGNHVIKLEHEFVKTLIFDDTENEIGGVLSYGSLKETKYKADLYFVASIVSLLSCGIGLLLPFGAKAYKLSKGYGFMTAEVEEKSSANVNPDKPYKKLVSKEEICIEGKCFSVKSPYFARANLSMIFGAINILVLNMLATLIKKPSFTIEDETTAGSLVFSTSQVQEINSESVSALISYSKHQSDENRQYFIDALIDLNDMIDESSRMEGERIARYEAEKFRSARKYATGTSVTTDGKDFYVSGTYGDGTEGSKKLEGYDRTTGVGYYTDESGKKVEVKNTNFKK